MNTEKESNGIPPAVIERLPQYLAFIREIRERVNGDMVSVSSLEIAQTLGLTASTVRQDFTHLKLAEGDKRGYEASNLEESLVEILGINQARRLVIVGAGNLGHALAQRGNFTKYGCEVRGIVDSNPEIVGDKVGDLTVFDSVDLVDLVRDEQIDVGVIAVPDAAAQEVADKLVEAGVKGLLNLAFKRIAVPEDVEVVEGRIVSSLLLLSRAMSNKK